MLDCLAWEIMIFDSSLLFFTWMAVGVEKKRGCYSYDGRSSREEGVVTIWRLGLGLWELLYDTHAIQGEDK